MLGGFFGVMLRLYMVAMRQVSVVAGLFVFARFVVRGGRPVVLGGFLVVFGCLTMMVRVFVRHGDPLFPGLCEPVCY